MKARRPEDSYAIRRDEAGAADAENGGGFRFEKPLKKLIAVLAVLFAAECLWLFVVSPCMPFGEVRVSGLPELDKAEALRAAGITPRSSYVSTREARVERGLESLPAVKTARARKRFPDTLSITLEGRAPLAVSFVELDGAVVPAVFDEEGVVFEVGREARAGARTPVVSGIFASAPRPGDRTDAAFDGFLASLKELRESSGGLLDSVSEIRVNTKAYNTFDLLIYPQYNRTKIRMSALSEEKLRYMFLLLDVLAEKNEDVEELDFRTGTASYKTRESRAARGNRAARDENAGVLPEGDRL